MSTEVNLSSNTLFHFTSKADYLVDIIKNGFKPRFCLEEEMLYKLLTSKKKVETETAIPLTCFCDLPLSKILSHLEFYGSYGIGLSKDWGMSNGLSPVNYIYEESTNFMYLKKMSRLIYNVMMDIDTKKYGLDKNPIIIISEMSSFLKPYDGKMERFGKYIKRKFYDEREWRYVPKIIGEKAEYRLSKEEFDDKIKRAQANSDLDDSYNLKFVASDIKYIIVSNEKEMISMSDIIDSLNTLYSENEIKLLKTKIISSDQIKEDF